jgi:hypothetical protein
MRLDRRFSWLTLSLLLALAWPATARAYIGGPPLTLGMMCYWSTHAALVRVEKVDKEKRVIVYRKVRDLKGKWPAEVIRHAIGPGAGDRQYILDWAEPGKITLTFALESYKWSHTYVDSLWYASNTADWQWWTFSHPEPILLRGFSGKPEKLVAAAGAVLAGQEVVVPCMVDVNPQDLAARRAKLQRLRASMKRLDYNAKRDFVSWGGDDFSPLAGMPGFSHYSALSRVGPDARAIACIDLNGDGNPGLCLVGANKTILYQNGGDAFVELALPGMEGCVAAVWADYNGDGKPDLLLATPTGPKLFTNLGNGNFRDDSALLPREPSYDLTAAAWIDHDGDGKPDILLGNGFHGLRLYRNKGKAEVPPGPAPKPQPGKPPVPPQPLWFEDVSVQVGLGPDGVGGSVKGDTLTVCDVNGDGRPDFLYGAGSGLLVLNTPKGFVEAKDSGIAYKPGKVGPVFGDFDNDGHPDLFVPQHGVCKLFHNDGTGHFTDVTDKAGDLARPVGEATCAAWGDFTRSGHPDLVVGCLRGPNRFFRNRGDGTFADATEALGLHKRIFNTQAVCLVDLNNDGMLDMVFNNEGQESAVLLGNPACAAKGTPVTIRVAGSSGLTGSQVRIVGKDGRLYGTEFLGGGSGRCQRAPVAHFAVPAGTYQVEVRYSTGVVRGKVVTVAGKPLRGAIDEQTPKVE